MVRVKDSASLNGGSENLGCSGPDRRANEYEDGKRSNMKSGLSIINPPDSQPVVWIP